MADGKIVLEGLIELLSPVLIGNGNDDHSDCDVILDANGKPYIPATSFIGALKHQIKPTGHDDELKKFWGFSEDDKGMQSNIICSDLRQRPRNDANVVVRDGIKINNRNGMVEKKKDNTGMKYDYEVINKGAEFALRMEINFSNGTKTFSEQMASTMSHVLRNNNICIGAKTNSGLGRVRLKNGNLYKYDFTNKQDVCNWLTGKAGSSFSSESFPLEKMLFTIDATLRLKNSFIIRSYSEEPNAPDSTSMKSGDDYVITGTSLKGAIRNRAERIIKTLGKSEDIVTELFGYVNENDSSDKAKKGRVQICEVILPKFASELQSRIKIDRFTGGVITGALFDSMPLFSKGEEIKKVQIIITDYRGYEAGLMLLVLKDLWTGDLAVGGEKNVGRGVLEGISATVSWGEEPITLTNSMLASELPKLEKFVQALTNNLGGE